MIIDKLVQFLFAFLNGVMNLLPAFTLPDFGNSGAVLGSALNGVNAVFPIVTLGIALGALMVIRLYIFAYGVVIYVYKLLPFKAT